eukprot:CAMPEP_0184028218 /NCGR_PEP_ID=MMETSP0954-20121128/14684_1 /TAXON_ID=627963 /ORGANISM="Aplanochytrium sp, Strain PBS07" /LENGTH=304 /DNA_ID=CAMNT_0026312969 /DNA_START=79 /DNA_END=993 /DNA_ORIENTATION=+
MRHLLPAVRSGLSFRSVLSNRTYATSSFQPRSNGTQALRSINSVSAASSFLAPRHQIGCVSSLLQLQTRTVFAQKFRRNEKRQRLALKRKKAAKDKRNQRVWRIRAGDEVFVEGKEYADPEDRFGRGAKGIVQLVDRMKEIAYVKGVNEQDVEKFNSQTGQRYSQRVNLPVPYSSLYLLDPVDGQPTGSKYVILEDGRSARISNRTGEEIPFYQKSPTPHKTHLFDTEPNDVLAITLTDAEIDIVGEYDEMNQNLFQKRERQRREARKMEQKRRLLFKKMRKTENLRRHKIHNDHKKKSRKKSK